MNLMILAASFVVCQVESPERLVVEKGKIVAIHTVKQRIAVELDRIPGQKSGGHSRMISKTSKFTIDGKNVPIEDLRAGMVFRLTSVSRRIVQLDVTTVPVKP